MALFAPSIRSPAMPAGTSPSRKVPPPAGVLATAGGLVFAAVADGNLIALEAATGKLLWHYQTGERIKSSPMSFAVDGTQYVAVSSARFCSPSRCRNHEPSALRA